MAPVGPEPESRFSTTAFLLTQSALALLVWGIVGYSAASASWLFDAGAAAPVLRFFWQFPVIGFAGAILLPAFFFERLLEATRGAGPSSGLVSRILLFPRRVALADFATSVFLATLGAMELRILAAMPVEECLKVFLLGPVTGIVFGTFSYLILRDRLRPLAAVMVSRGSGRPPEPDFPIVSKVALCCLSIALVTIGIYGPIALTWAERSVEADAAAKVETSLSSIVQEVAHAAPDRLAWPKILEAQLSTVDRLVVFDRNGTAVASAARPGSEGIDIFRAENRELLLGNPSRYFVSRRNESAVVASTLLSRGARLFAALRPDRAAEERLLSEILRLSGVVLLLSALLSWIAGRGVAGPIARLEEETREFGNDPDRASITPIPSDDETGALSLAFSEMAESVRAMRNKLSRSERLAGAAETLAAVAHEVRNPLFGITSTLAALEADLAGDARYTAHFDIVRRESQRLSRMIDEMLNLKSAPEVHLAPGDLKPVIESAVSWVPRRFPDRRIRVDFSADGPAAAVAMDAGRLSQVFANLLENGVLASTDPATISIRLGVSAGVATVEIEDEGAGIPPEHLSKIFDPFFSLRAGGTGLGLSICRRIVDEHGGSIEVESRQPRGTRFCVRLPVPNSDGVV